MLDYVNITNFKSIAKAEIELKKINLFIGANRTGKSTVSHAVSLLKQSKENIRWNGEYIKLASFERALNKKAQERYMTIQLGGRLPASPSAIRAFSHRDIIFALHIGIVDGTVNDIGFKLSVGEGEFGKDIVSGAINRQNTGIQQRLQSDNFQIVFSGNLNPHHPVIISSGKGVTPENQKQYEIVHAAVTEVLNIFERQFKQIGFIPASRGFDQPQYFMYEDPPQDIPTSEGSSKQAEALANQIAYSNRRIEDKVNELLGKVIPGVQIRQYTVPRKNIEIVSKDDAGEYNVTQEGFGLNQLSFLFAQLVATEPHSTLFIEEPEISLHPALQMSVCSLLIDKIVKENKQLVMTTHSEHILLGILEAVMDKKLKPDDIRVYFFERDEQNLTKTTKLKVNEFGELEGGLKGFFEVDMKHIEKFFEHIKKEKT